MEPTDIVERLREVYAGDHERGCDARYHVCKCGFDRRAETAAQNAAAEIRRLRAALAKAKLAEELWRTGGLSSNEAMVGISADLRARG